MQFIESIYLHDVAHGGDPVKVATEIFETHNFDSIGVEVVGVSGAESETPQGTNAWVKIPFFAKNLDENQKDSTAMLFCVEFDKKGTHIQIYED